MTQSKGRLVLNHSTHLPGLIPLLEKLIQFPGIQTVTPGVINSVRAHVPHLKLKISVPIRGGFKMIARQGKTVQEVFIITTLTQAELEVLLTRILKK
jgi:hypothetical protein